MEIQGIGSNPLIQSIMSQLESLSKSAQEQDTSASSLLDASATMQLSGPGKMLAGLEQAYENDPEQFAATLNSLADQLEAAAEKTTDSMEKARITDMAQRLRTVAETGDVSQLKPPPPPGMGPGKGGPMGAYAQNESQSLKSLIDYLSENEDSATMDMDTLLQRVDDLIAQLIGGGNSEDQA